MATRGKMELRIRLFGFPKDHETTATAQKSFQVSLADGTTVQLRVSASQFRKLEQAERKYESWEATLVASAFEISDQGLIVLEPAITIAGGRARSADDESFRMKGDSGRYLRARQELLDSSRLSAQQPEGDG